MIFHKRRLSSLTLFSGPLLRSYLFATLFFGSAVGVYAGPADGRKPLMKTLVEDNFRFADSQYQYMMTLLPPNKMPQTYDSVKKKIVSHEISWWCTGFYPGSLWYIYEQTANPAIKKEAERALQLIEPNKTYTGNHDLGFMMYCSFGNAYRITQNEAYKQIIFQSAESLSTRYRPTVKAIQSWNSNSMFKCPVIIDNMMNLEMLYWVSNNGGESRFKDIAIAHSNTTLKNHFHEDHSSYHVIDYDPATGKVIRKATWQGAADCSPWSRGQGWALYGYTMMYRFTHNKAYLKLARQIARFIINHPNMPEDKIPYWDFAAPRIPFAPRDASAAALIASALLELGQYTSGTEKEKNIDIAEQILTSLSGPKYRAQLGENGGFLLKHSTGGLPLNSEIDVPLIYADYYYLEALKRYKEWYLK